MEKKKDRSYIIILVLLLIIFICSFLLYRNINAGVSGNDNEVIGILTFKNKTIERKYDSDVIWEKVESGLVIRNKDTIRSGDFSDAILTLKDKTKIDINENSMIYLDISDNSINLNFAYGSMSLSKQDDGSSSITLKIKSGQNTVEVKNSELVLEKKGKEDLAFQIKKGTAKILNGSQEKELKTNESVTVNNSEIQIREIGLDLVNPPDSALITGKSDSIPVNFEWIVKNGSKLKLDIAYDSRFQNLYKSYKVGNDSYSTSLPQGHYYWRISSEKNKNNQKKEREYSSFRKLTVYSSYPPTITSPQKNQNFSYTNILPIISFSWKPLESAKNYRLEISKNSEFTEIIKTITTSQTSIGIDKLDVGKYYSRLITDPSREEFKQEKSEVVPFSIEKKTELEPPILVSPVNGQEFSTPVFAKSGLTLRVKDSPEISKYIFQVSQQSSFSKPIIEQPTNGNEFKITSKLEIGTYYWRVFGSTNDGRKTSFSETGKFIVKENQPVELLSPKNNTTLDIKENPISFRWKKLPYKSNFLFELADNPGFSETVQKLKTEEYSVSFAVPKEGNYYWRITSLAEDDEIISKTAIFSFKLEDVKQLIPIFPNKFERVDMAHLDSIIFKWEKNPKIAFYNFALYREKSGSRVLVTKAKTKKGSFLFKELSKLDEGNFIWSLEEIPEDEENKTGKKISVPFKIFLSEKPGTPQIKTPKKMYVE